MKRHYVWALALFYLSFTSCTALRHNVPNITDYKLFDTQKVQKSDHPFVFPRTNSNVSLPDEFLWAMGNKDDKYYEYATPEMFLEATGTNALIIIRNDSVLYENYFNGFTADSIQTVFSVTKAFAATLTAIAIEEGFIKDINQPVSDFVPAFKEKGRDKITINHLLQMTSGVNEKDFRDLARLLWFYYSKDQEARCEKLKMRYDAGTRFQYSSMTTQILGMCVERATGKKFAEYLEEKIWKPLGMEHDALVSTDKNGSAKQYGGLSVRPIDLAKYGMLYMNEGKWNGKQIIPESWVRATQTRDTIEGRSPKYSHCFWLDTYPLENVFNKSDFFAGGFRGQVVYVNPENNTVMVRTGNKEAGVHWGRSLSKLSQFPLKTTDGSIDEKNIAELNGIYQNKFGKELNLSIVDGKIRMNRGDEEAESIFEPSSGITFEDKAHNKKVLVKMRTNKILGLILEEGKESYYYSKN
jgi:CubicO group peptidase (beta-lactamase class C family)